MRKTEPSAKTLAIAASIQNVIDEAGEISAIEIRKKLKIHTDDFRYLIQFTKSEKIIMGKLGTYYYSVKKEPCLRVQELTAQAQAIVDSSNGVKGDDLRETLGVNQGLFKHVTRLLNCVKKRNGYKFAYCKSGTPQDEKPKPPPQYEPLLLEVAQKMQVIIDENDGVNGLQIRKELGITLAFFKRAVRHIKAERKKVDTVMTYYKLSEEVPPKPFEVVKYTVGEPVRTIWQTEQYWMAA